MTKNYSRVSEESKLSRTYIVAAKRTAIGKMNGSLATKSAVDLGSYAIKGAVNQSKIDPNNIDQVLMGNVIQAGVGQNPARQAAVKAGLDFSIPAITINDVCGSGLSSVNLAASLIAAGQAQVVIAGGMESMSLAPFVVQKDQVNDQFDRDDLIDTVQSDALTDAWGGYQMGMTAENIADNYHVTREQMDEFSFNSHMKAVDAQRTRAFEDEIVPIDTVTADQAVRPDTSIEKLATLKPVFKDQGTVTAGNASGLNDGAAVVMLASQEAVEKFNLTPLAEWVDAAFVGLDPHMMGMGPYYAVSQLLEKQQMNASDVDTFELNEAFAAQSIACINELGIDQDRVNPNGGAIALGHPVGASGSRILVTLIYDLLHSDAQTGVASLCIGGGMGAATLIKKTTNQ